MKMVLLIVTRSDTKNY